MAEVSGGYVHGGRRLVWMDGVNVVSRGHFCLDTVSFKLPTRALGLIT